MITTHQHRSLLRLVLLAIPFVYLCSHTCYAHALTIAEPLAVVQTILINDVPQTETSNVDSLQVEVKRANTGQVEPARVGMELYKDDEVTTGDLAQVTLVFAKPDSEDRIEVMLKEKSSARLGSIFSYFGSFFVSGLGVFDTRTSYVRLGKRGTEFELVVTKEGEAELKVLSGEVDVEKLDPEPTGNHHPRRRTETPQPRSRKSGSAEIKIVKALEALEIRKERPLPLKRSLRPDEILPVLNWTDKLIIASFPATPPKNIISTTFDKSAPDSSAAAISAFKSARLKATLQPSATNVQTLGDTYKDLGDGKRSTVAYIEAVKLNPSIKDSSVFLANQAEAYRLSGNFTKAEGLLREATAKLPGDPNSQQLVLNASGNLSYDKAIYSILKGDSRSANRYFIQSQSAYEGADSKSQNSETSATIHYNLVNVMLAFGPDAKISSNELDLTGTYRGTIDFPSEGLEGASVLVITGNRFNLHSCEGSLTGSLVTRKGSEHKTLVDLVFDSLKGVKRLSLQEVFFRDNQISLSDAPGETNDFSFSGSEGARTMPCQVANTKYRLMPNPMSN